MDLSPSQQALSTSSKTAWFQLALIMTIGPSLALFFYQLPTKLFSPLLVPLQHHPMEVSLTLSLLITNSLKRKLPIEGLALLLAIHALMSPSYEDSSSLIIFQASLAALSIWSMHHLSLLHFKSPVPAFFIATIDLQYRMVTVLYQTENTQYFPLSGFGLIGLSTEYLWRWSSALPALFLLFYAYHCARAKDSALDKKLNTFPQ